MKTSILFAIALAFCILPSTASAQHKHMQMMEMLKDSVMMDLMMDHIALDNQMRTMMMDKKMGGEKEDDQNLQHNQGDPR